MALLTCIECGGKVSSYAVSCPHCGCPAEYQIKQKQDNTIEHKNQTYIGATSVTETTIKARQVKNLSEWRTIKNLVKSGHKDKAIDTMVLLTGTDRNKCRSLADKMDKMIGLSAEIILQEFPDQVETDIITNVVVRDNWKDNISKTEKELLIKRLAYPQRWDDIIERISRQKNSLIEMDSICKDIAALVNTDDIYLVKEIYRYIEHTKELPLEILSKNFPKQFLKIKTTTTLCTACSRQISTKAETCPHCGNPTGVHVCPKCGSTNTHVIVGVDKAISVALWGRFAANEVMSKYACYDCRHKW